MLSEQQFVEKLKNQDEQAYRELIDSYKNKVLKTALSFIPFKEDAEDVAQEVFIDVFKNIQNFRQDASISTWIYRITVNKSLNYIKRNRKYIENRSIDDYYTYENVHPHSNHNETSSYIESKQLAQAIHNALLSLAERQRVVFVMHKIEGKSYKEISDVLRISLFSVESLMHRAKLNLQKKLKNFKT